MEKLLRWRQSILVGWNVSMQLGQRTIWPCASFIIYSSTQATHTVWQSGLPSCTVCDDSNLAGSLHFALCKMRLIWLLFAVRGSPAVWWIPLCHPPAAAFSGVTRSFNHDITTDSSFWIISPHITVFLLDAAGGPQEETLSVDCCWMWLMLRTLSHVSFPIFNFRLNRSSACKHPCNLVYYDWSTVGEAKRQPEKDDRDQWLHLYFSTSMCGLLGAWRSCCGLILQVSEVRNCYQSAIKQNWPPSAKKERKKTPKRLVVMFRSSAVY